MKTTLTSLTLALGLSFATINAQAADYAIDTKGAHASINFKIQHLGYSWLVGRFNQFDGEFSLEDDMSKSAVSVTIDTSSIDSNHAERDKHLRGDDFLNVDKFPEATFKSTKVVPKGDGKFDLHGELTLHGVTKSIVIDAYKIGEGKDPWGGYRAGFMGSTKLKLADYGITYNLGPASTHVDMELHVEGVRK
ncbi:YceI family protein [Aestuariibacter sp. AA17]|uniref:YceI family protein n=1 Tax=Fluctibacter corallii TaxID=2984329 RepID=A0ABT3A8Q8_9ALTE|nr:YceI family protein [Aestuariibacter sp. AA17]MCV2885074.1 YceI family protein [Aestuariibacter sp. AA17]